MLVLVLVLVVRRRHRRQRIQIVHPRPEVIHQRRRILNHQVPSAFISMHLCLRHTLAQIVEVAVTEHRITRTPQQQDRHIQPAHAFRDAIQRRRTRMTRAHRDVFDEIPHGSSSIGSLERRPEGPPDVFGHTRPTQRSRDAYEDRKSDGVERSHGSKPCRGNDMRNSAVLGLVHRGVGQDHASHLRTMR